MAIKTINLTPDPRILRMLGQIELKGWQCVAELVDNSIDAMLKNQENISIKEINVDIPSRAELNRNAPLIIRDNGVGMNIEELESCLKAGYTSKSSDNLGLFGMGFNIATARLGDVVEVWSSTREMDKDIGVRIDLTEMQRTKSFERELLIRNKSFHPSGTSIEISKFHPRAEKLLNKTHISKELNRVYSKNLLEINNISIKVNDVSLKPHIFCVWDEERYVTYEGERINAIQKFSKDFGERDYCSRCFIWLDEYQNELTVEAVCPNCLQSDLVQKRKINVHGWVGIQRFNDLENFGINIIRNGRIIKKLDKSLFIWQDRRNRNNGDPIKDYPIDTTAQGGRIVGEITANFITPTYTKDSFEETDKLWLDAVEVVRGISPLQPKTSENLGFSKNQSPLAKLFYGYRRSHPPGLRHLIPGNKNGQGLYTEAKRWAELFYAGDPEYQTDEKWYQAVLEAELVDDDDNTDPTITNVTNETSVSYIKRSGLSATIPDQINELFPGRKLQVQFQKIFDLRPLINESPFGIEVYHFWPESSILSPIIFEPIQASKFNVYINNNHPLFKDFADGWEDLIWMEVANKFYEKISDVDSWPVSRIYYELKKKYAASQMLNIQALVSEAKAIVTDLQNFLVLEYQDIKLYPSPELKLEEIKLLKQNYLQIELSGLTNFDELKSTTNFIKYMDHSYVIDFVKQYPELVYDGKYFSLPYNSLEEEFKDRQLDQYNGYFNDIKWFIYDLSNYPDALIKQQKDLIIRNRYSLEFLNGKTA